MITQHNSTRTVINCVLFPDRLKGLVAVTMTWYASPNGNEVLYKYVIGHVTLSSLALVTCILGVPEVSTAVVVVIEFWHCLYEHAEHAEHIHTATQCT